LPSGWWKKTTSREFLETIFFLIKKGGFGNHPPGGLTSLHKHNQKNKKRELWMQLEIGVLCTVAVAKGYPTPP
jgi:hypothetical protein